MLYLNSWFLFIKILGLDIKALDIPGILDKVTSPISLLALVVIIIGGSVNNITIFNLNTLKEFNKGDRLSATSKFLNHQTINRFLIFVSIIWLFYIVYPTKPFDLTVLVREKPSNKIPDLHKGEIIINFRNGKPRTSKIEENCEATFTEIPSYFSGDSAIINIVKIEGEPYQALCNSCKYLVSQDNNVTIYVQKYHLDKIRGYVFDVDGNPIVDASVRILEDMKNTTDKSGFFYFNIPDSNQLKIQTLYVSKPGFQTLPVTITVYTQRNPMQITLKRIGQK